MEQIAFSREELYDLVWAMPVAHISRKYSINAVEIRQACKEMNVPLPKMGYWQKIKFGKASNVERLPENHIGIVTVTFNCGQYQKEKKHDKVIPSEFIVPAKLTNPDKLVIAAKSEISKNKYKDKGRVYTNRGYLSIRVSTEHVERALIFMDALIKLLRSKAYNLIVNDNGTYAVVESEEIKISLVEKVKRKMIPGPHWNTAEYTPSGVIAFRIDGESYGRNSYEWTDGKEKVEMKLDAILSKLVLESKRLKDEREKWRLIREQSERDRLVKVDRERNRDRELTKFKELLLKSKRYQEVMAIRAFIDAVEVSTTDNDLKKEKQDWISWAREKADWYDPMVEKIDEIFNDINRDTLKSTLYY